MSKHRHIDVGDYELKSVTFSGFDVEIRLHDQIDGKIALISAKGCSLFLLSSDHMQNVVSQVDVFEFERETAQIPPEIYEFLGRNSLVYDPVQALMRGHTITLIQPTTGAAVLCVSETMDIEIS